MLGNANLFLINPNGIFFAPNARLDLGGSFFGSTADSLLLDENGEAFSAKNPNGVPLLTINVPFGLQYGSNPGAITNQSSLLQVRDGQTLGLIGGGVNIPGGNLTATDGRIELGSVAGNSVVTLSKNTSFVLDYAGVLEFRDISLSEGAFVDTSGDAGGSIFVQGAIVTLGDRSNIFADTNGSGNGGGIVVRASQLSLEGGSRIVATVFGSGVGGDLTVDARDSVGVNGESADGTISILGTRVFSEAGGNGGSVEISTGSLFVTNGARISASTSGVGNAGTISINATDTVSFEGEDSRGIGVIVGSGVRRGGQGDAGGVTIFTGSLELEDGAQISASTFGVGNAGSVSITATDTVRIDGGDSQGNISGINSGVAPGAVGNAEGVTISTGSLFVTNGAQISASTFGEGNAGSVSITATDTVSIDGEDSFGQFSGVLSQVERVGVGNAGGVEISTGSLRVTNGAFISANTLGVGNAGSVNITATDTVSLNGEDSLGFGSIVSSQVASGAEGDAGGTAISTGSLELEDGAFISASTLGVGNAGSVSITATDTVSFDGESSQGIRSGAYSSVPEEAVGDAGGTAISTGSLSLTNGGTISVTNLGQGAAGELKVKADSILLSNQGVIQAETNGGGEGNITLEASEIRLRNNSSITTNAQNATGGNINIETDTLVGLENSDITANAEEGAGGLVNINAHGYLWLKVSGWSELHETSDITATSNLGPQFRGEVILNTPSK